MLSLFGGYLTIGVLIPACLEYFSSVFLYELVMYRLAIILPFLFVSRFISRFISLVWRWEDLLLVAIIFIVSFMLMFIFFKWCG